MARLLFSLDGRLVAVERRARCPALSRTHRTGFLSGVCHLGSAVLHLLSGSRAEGSTAVPHGGMTRKPLACLELSGLWPFRRRRGASSVLAAARRRGVDRIRSAAANNAARVRGAPSQAIWTRARPLDRPWPAAAPAGRRGPSPPARSQG